MASSSASYPQDRITLQWSIMLSDGECDFNGQPGWVSNQVVSANTEAQAVAAVLALPSPTPCQ